MEATNNRFSGIVEVHPSQTAPNVTYGRVAVGETRYYLNFNGLKFWGNIHLWTAYNSFNLLQLQWNYTTSMLSSAPASVINNQWNWVCDKRVWKWIQVIASIESSMKRWNHFFLNFFIRQDVSSRRWDDQTRLLVWHVIDCLYAICGLIVKLSVLWVLYGKMQSLWLLLVITIVKCQDEVSTDTPSIYYTEPSIPDAKSLTELTGGHIIGGQRILERTKSPYVLREDLYVEEKGELVIQPGVEIRFAPMIGITVRGIITAKVNTSNDLFFLRF